ncbi:MAG: Gfo/Idh/MocA family oxidoreductase [Flavobacteriales bacterium]|nr:Gfo/Idh/MocA family oxidoreductase [Flavobacteriales bacterium]
MYNIGVLGAGHLGQIHLKLLKEIKEYNVIGFYDPDEEKSKAAAKKFKLKAFDSVDELIAASDIIDIVTPTLSHYDCAVKALRASKHCFIEKPITNTVQEAKELIDLTSEANVKVQIGHVERYNPAFIAAKPFCSEPMFIEAHRLAKFNPRGTDVSVVLDLMIHDIDIILSIVKSNIKRISASGVAVISETPDITNARIEFANGCVANLTASRMSLKNMRKTRFFQRDAYISVDFLKKKASVVSMSEPDNNFNPLSMKIEVGKNREEKQINFNSPKIKNTNAIKDELEDFLDAIKNDTEPLVTIDDGYAALDVATTIIELIKKSPDFEIEENNNQEN